MADFKVTGKCKLCGKEQPTESYVDIPVEDQPIKIVCADCNGKMWSCRYCGRKFNRSDLGVHERDHKPVVDRDNIGFKHESRS